METTRVKRYVEVNADYMPDGSVCPHSIVLDQQQYLIERVVKVEQTHVPGRDYVRRRFHIIVKGTETSLFLENERWYVRKKIVYPTQSYSDQPA